MRLLALTAIVALTIACGGEEQAVAPPPDETACGELEIALVDGSCTRPGVPLDGCAEGFVHDDAYGCEPILPAEPCPLGAIAVVGDSACRPIMSCGQGKWGNLPTDATTQFVDGAYAGGDGDGSEGRPWPTIGEAIAAAAPGALVAVAEGSYAEELLIDNQPVRLWGVCPERVEIVSSGANVSPCPPATVCVLSGADGSEIGGLSLRGDGVGIVMSGVYDVLVDRVHVHDNNSRGIAIESIFGPGSLEVRDSLVERSAGIGIVNVGSDLHLSNVAVRNTLPDPGGAPGRGVTIEMECVASPTGVTCDPSKRATASIERTVIEQSRNLGVFVGGADLVMKSSVVRTTLPDESTLYGGSGMSINNRCEVTSLGLVCDPATRSTATIEQSVIADNLRSGVQVIGSQLSMASSVVRDTQPSADDQRFGLGLSVQSSCDDTPIGFDCDFASGSSDVSVKQSVFERNHDSTIVVLGSAITLDASVVRATAAQQSDGLAGDGVVIVGFEVGDAALSRSTIDDSARGGVASFGAPVTLADMRIRCAPLPLVGELGPAGAHAIEDLGGNICGCAMAEEACKVVSSGLTPPAPLPNTE